VDHRLFTAHTVTALERVLLPNRLSETITDSGSSTPPRSVAEARSSPSISTRRTEPLLFCAAPFRQLPGPHSAIASVCRAERVLSSLFKHQRKDPEGGGL
jgi:hypothetical protein